MCHLATWQYGYPVSAMGSAGDAMPHPSQVALAQLLRMMLVLGPRNLTWMLRIWIFHSLHSGKCCSLGSNDHSVVWIWYDTTSIHHPESTIQSIRSKESLCKGQQKWFCCWILLDISAILWSMIRWCVLGITRLSAHQRLWTVDCPLKTIHQHCNLTSCHKLPPAEIYTLPLGYYQVDNMFRICLYKSYLKKLPLDHEKMDHFDLSLCRLGEPPKKT